MVKPVSKQAYKLELPAHRKILDVFHVSQQQVDRRSGLLHPAELLEGEPDHEVHHIVRHRGIRKHKNKPADVEYLVAWRGSSPSEYTW